tara:strand:+ start:22322 stop:25054 length:2733 start_codon:yes stop_codon:yes gene_type:complete
MPYITSTDEYFKVIKDNHKKFLEQNMISSLKIFAEQRSHNQINTCVNYMNAFCDFKAVYLNRSTKQASFGSQIKHGSLAALLGIGIGSLSFFATKSNAISETFNPLAGVNDISAGTFSALLGAAVSIITYQLWQKTTKNPAVEDFEKFQECMQKAGFNNEKYKALSSELVKLFHYRECLLLNFKDNFDIPFRDEFKEKYLIDNEKIDDEIIDVAIEVYFLEQLNLLFNSSFKNIYIIQDDEIKEEQGQIKIISWIKKLFDDEQTRKIFTQQLQIQFMEQCLNYLELQMLEPGFLAQYPLLTTSLTGLMTGATTFCCIIAFTGLMTLAAISFSFVATTISLFSSYLAINYFDCLKYKRDEKNRFTISKTIKNITKECERLNNLIKDMIETTSEDFTQLDKYQDKISGHSTFCDFHLFCNPDKHIAIGASASWAREYASRYRHNKSIEIDLKKTHKEIIEISQIQTQKLQDILYNIIIAKKEKEAQEPYSKLMKFIHHTKHYLTQESNQNFINRFEIIYKIKEQILEIISIIPSHIINSIPKELEEFYTAPINQGGLYGLKYDLIQARYLAPTPLKNFSCNNFYTKLLHTAQKLNFLLSNDINNEFILTGDTEYRKRLGLNINSNNEDIIFKINSRNINKYLNTSFSFLYSLNKPDVIDQPIENSNEFILYRTLLLKQLANLVNSNNNCIEKSIKKEILLAVKAKFKVDPNIVIDDIFNQSLFAKNENQKCTLSIKDPLGNECLICDLEFISDAIRLDLSYISQPITPKMIIDIEASEFLFNKKPSHCFLFGYNHDSILVPEISKKYVEKLITTITVSKEFIFKIINNNLLGSLRYLNYYLDYSIKEVSNLSNNIAKLVSFINNNKMPEFDHSYINNAKELLDDYNNNLKDLLHDVKTGTRPLNAKLFLSNC